jgi:outer membrane protein assembly factor BamB
MRTLRHPTTALLASLAAAAIGSHAPASGASTGPFGTIWVANRDPAVNTIRAFDGGTGEIVRTVEMAPRSEPGDLAVANGKVYVSEERGDAPAIAVVDAATGTILRRFFTGRIRARIMCTRARAATSSPLGCTGRTPWR